MFGESSASTGASLTESGNMLVEQVFQVDRTHLATHQQFCDGMRELNESAKKRDGDQARLEPIPTEAEYEESLKMFLPEAIPGYPGCYYHGCGGRTCGGGRKRPQEGRTVPPLWAQPDLSELFTEEGDVVIEYGICDDVQNFLDVYGEKLQKSSKRFVVLFREHLKEDNGMRWHKHGPYIGKQKTEGYEYISEEPHVGTVWTYSIAELVPEGEPLTPDWNEGFNLWLKKRHEQARMEISQ